MKENDEGFILFENKDEWRKLFFRDGVVTSASSSTSSDYLGQYLLSFGVITPDQFEKAYPGDFETRENMDNVHHYASAEELKQLISEKIINTIFIATRWPEGEYSIISKSQDKYYEVDVELSMKDIEKGLKERIVEFQGILDTVPELGARPKIDYMESRGFEISDLKEVVLNHLIAGKTIDEILKILPAHNYLLLKTIYKLIRMGIFLKGTGAPFTKEEIINYVNNSEVLKESVPLVADFFLDASSVKKAYVEMGENKYRTVIAKYQKLTKVYPENLLYAHLYEQAKSCFIVHFYLNRLSPFAVVELSGEIDDVSNLSKIDKDLFHEFSKKEALRVSVRNLVKSMETWNEVDVLISISKLMEADFINESEPETLIDAIKLGRDNIYEKLYVKKDKNKLFEVDIYEDLTPLMSSAISGNYPQEIAAEFGSGSFVKGVEPVLHDYKMTSLMLASMIGNYEAVEFLLSKGVKTETHNGNGVTALMLALENSYDDVALLLIRKGADVSAKNKNDYSALMIAAAKGLSHVVDYMIRLDVDLNQVNSNGQTALISALRFNNEDIVVSLIAAGVDLVGKDKEGHDPIFYAESVVVTELIRKGARFSQQIRKKKIKGKKQHLKAYKRNLVKDEKDVVPTSYHAYIFFVMILGAVLILLYYYFIR